MLAAIVCLRRTTITHLRRSSRRPFSRFGRPLLQSRNVIHHLRRARFGDFCDLLHHLRANLRACLKSFGRSLPNVCDMNGLRRSPMLLIFLVLWNASLFLADVQSVGLFFTRLTHNSHMYLARVRVVINGDYHLRRCCPNVTFQHDV